jgi:small conductance mechanosensitive channel
MSRHSLVTTTPPRRRIPFLRDGAPLRPIEENAWRSHALETARRARRRLVVLVPLLAAIIAAYTWRMEIFGVDEPVRLVTALAMTAIGWSLAGGLAGVITGRLSRFMEPGTAGVAGFVLRLGLLLMAILVSLRLAGLPLGTVALGASFTAVVVGLAAQQTLGNVFAGIVLLAARPFQIGDRVRFAGFGMDVEGTVAAHGLLYVTCDDGEDAVLVPNNTALTMSVRPIREPAKVDLRARLPADVDPEAVEARVAQAISVATRGTPEVGLEEYLDDEIVVRIRASPRDPAEGGRLAREVLGAVTAVDRRRDAA